MRLPDALQTVNFTIHQPLLDRRTTTASPQQPVFSLMKPHLTSQWINHIKRTQLVQLRLNATPRPAVTRKSRVAFPGRLATLRSQLMETQTPTTTALLAAKQKS